MTLNLNSFDSLIEEFQKNPPNVPPIWADYEDGDVDQELKVYWTQVDLPREEIFRVEQICKQETQEAVNIQYNLGYLNKYGLPVGMRLTPEQKEFIKNLEEEEALKKKYEKLKRRKYRL